MDKVTLVVQPRDLTGSRAARRLRATGLVPGVLYGHGKAATMFAVDPHALRAALTTDAGTHAVLDVVIEGHKRGHKAIVKQLDRDKVKNSVAHVDLQEIRLDETIETTVAVRFDGEAKGVKAGGVLDELVHEVAVKGVVTAIPEHLVLDISELEVNEQRTFGDLVLPEGLELIDDPETLLCSVLPPRKAEAEEGAELVETPSAAEPEIVGKAGKEEAD